MYLILSNSSSSYNPGTRIHDIIEQKGLHPTDLAHMLYKEPSEIDQLLRGTYNFSIDTIAQIEFALGESILDVIGHSTDA